VRRKGHGIFGVACVCVLGLTAFLGNSAPPVGAADSFPGQGFLPDGRGYELVSPAAKNGSDVMASSSRVRSAIDGDAVTFGSLTGFGDVLGSGVAFDYMARRTGTPGTRGWVSHPINPRQLASTLVATFNGVDSFYDGEFTPDLDCGVYSATRPLPGIGDPANIVNLYLRDDLLSAGAGSYALLTVPLVPVEPSVIKSTIVAISSDCSHVLFESDVPLTADTAPCTPHVDCRPKLYEWVDGSLRLAGILPDGNPAPDSLTGPGLGSYKLGMLSPDGSKVFFSVPSTGDTYMRENGTTTVQLNAGVPGGPQPGTMWIVSADGNQAFFSSGADLYRFDATAPAGSELTLVSTDAAPGDGHSIDGVLGVSADGGSVYFFAGGQLVAGEPLLGASIGLYAWHAGELRFIGEVAAGAADSIPNSVITVPGFQPLASRVSQDGSRVLFTVRDATGYRDRWGFPGYDHGTSCNRTEKCQELYVFDADAGSLVCISCNRSGATANEHAFIDAASGVGASNRPVHLSHALSADGKRVFFHTAEALLPGDSNGRSDVYEYDVSSANLHLISSGKDPGDSYFMDASPNGNDVFFATRERLVGWDSDQNYDLYDARVGGGLPDPIPAQPACAGESCRGRLAAGPTPETAASQLSVGVGDTKSKLKSHRTRKKVKHCRHIARRHTSKHRCSRRKRVRRASATEKSTK
jgi:hypothetical protein